VELIVKDLSSEISYTSVIQFDGSYLVVRLRKKHGLSYGKLYGYMEILRNKFAIKEYSCKKATLEQIFNSFSNFERQEEFGENVRRPRP
jgi:hypothetical protein